MAFGKKPHGLTWWQKKKRSLIKRLLPGFVNSSDSYILQHVPEFMGQMECRLSQYREPWIRGNKTNNDKDLVRLLFLIATVEELKQSEVPGAFAELGVFRGNSAKVLHLLCPERAFYLFDTFVGFDERDCSDTKGAAGGFSNTSLQHVKRFIGEQENIHYCAGYFPETASMVPEGTRFALVHLDADLHAPTKAGLEYFYDRMEPGAFLILHDYHSGCYPGVMKAVKDFFCSRPEKPVRIPDKSGTAVIRKI